MLLQNLGRDRETKAGAALLGGEIREEQALAHLVGEAGTSVRYAQLDHAGIEESRRDLEFAEKGFLHGFGGVVDEVGEGALERFRIGEDQRKVRGKLADHGDVRHASGEERHRVFYNGVQVRRMGSGTGELREGGELIDQRTHCFNRRSDDFGATTDDSRRGALDGSLGEEGCEPIDVATNLLGVEGDGGEWVFDFVGDTARHFFPGALLLGAE